MAGTGGKRPGAGRKPGSKNKKVKSIVVKAAASGLMPVDYMLQVMRDEALEHNVRMDAAKNVAPYLTAKLAPKTQEDQGTPPELQVPVNFTIGVVDGRNS